MKPKPQIIYFYLIYFVCFIPDSVENFFIPLTISKSIVVSIENIFVNIIYKSIGKEKKICLLTV